MDSRRLTVFPKTGYSTDNADVNRSRDLAPANVTKRKFYSGDVPVDLTLPRVLAPSKSMHKVFTPIEENPGLRYQCVHLVDPDGKRPFCIAQERESKANESAYRIVMIRRSAERAVVGPGKPNPHLLNITAVFRYEGSLFTVFDRPGFPLSEIVVSHSPQLGVNGIKTISKEALHGICALNNAGFSLPSIELEDITISTYDGRVKVAFDRAAYRGPEVSYNATPFKATLESVKLHLPDRSELEGNEDTNVFIQCAGYMTYQELQKVDFLKDVLPVRSLIPFALNAEVSVIPVQRDVEAQISDLSIDSFGTSPGMVDSDSSALQEM